MEVNFIAWKEEPKQKEVSFKDKTYGRHPVTISESRDTEKRLEKFM